MLDELTARGIRWLTLRQRGSTELARLAALPAGQWKTATIARSGRYRRPQLHEDMIKLKDVDTKVRQIAIRNIGHDEPTLLITNDLTTPGKDLFARYAERMNIENELDAYISGFHLDALSAVSRSTSTSTPPSPSSPATSTASSPATSPDTRPPPPTPSGATSSMTTAPCTSPTKASPAHSTYAPPPPTHRRRLRRHHDPNPLVDNRTLQFTFPPR